MDFSARIRHFNKKASELTGKDFLPPQLVQVVTQVGRSQLDTLQALCANGFSPVTFTSVVENLPGRPVLPRAEFPVDEALLARLFDEFGELMRTLGGAMGQAAQLLSQAARSGELKLTEAARLLLADDAAFFSAWEERTPDAPKALRFLVQSAMTPGLAATALRLGDRLKLDQTHQHGHCPVCGSLPLILALRQKEGYSYATCSFCQTEYRIRRISCPVCDESDSTRLSYLYAEDEPGFRVHICETCSSYVKVVDFRQLDKVSVPVLDDLESLPLDILAQERGYKRPTLSAWGF